MKTERTKHIVVPPSTDEQKTIKIDDDSHTVRISDENEQSHNTTFGHESEHDARLPYAIQAKVGDGGMGVVYLAKDLKLDRYVAIKRLNAQANANLSLRKRFLNEARAVAALNHIYIVHIYSLGEDSEGPYIAMEYVEGPAATTGSRQDYEKRGFPHQPFSLDKQVSDNGQYTVNEAVDLLVKITKAIAYAHANGVIHRDLKPSNILLDITGEPKIVDFGLARLKGETDNKLTVPGEKLLSLGYGAPEQESDASVTDERADVYGLGGLLYFAITGKNPRYFREQDIPVTLREALGKALATDREQRWSTANEFLDALLAIQSRTRVEQPPAKTTWRCKWCDTINPVTIRFCSECGWDGVESCPECGAENFIGMQYCGKCGADMRVYESMLLLVDKMRTAVDADEYEKAVLISARAQGFEPAGESGREMLADIQQVRDHAQKQIARREQLKDIIPMEIRAENYERAKTFIDEYRSISGNKQFFSDEYAQLPRLIVKRDLKRTRQALKDGERHRALRICDELLRNVAPDDTDCVSLHRRIVTRININRALVMCAVATGIVFLYVAALPVVCRISDGQPTRIVATLWQPATQIYSLNNKTASLMRRYATAVCGNNANGLIAGFSVPTAPIDEPRDIPDDMASLKKEFDKQLGEASAMRLNYDKYWRKPYMDELRTIGERHREAGNYREWQCVNTERKQFETSNGVGAVLQDDPSDLRELKIRFISNSKAVKIDSARNTVQATKKYLNSLDGLLRKYTKEGNMVAAAYIDGEIRRVGNFQEYKDAETILAADNISAADATKVTATVLRTGDRLESVKPIRKEYDNGIVTIEREYQDKVNIWPELYKKALTTLTQQYQDAASFAEWDVTKAELERFELDLTLTHENIVSTPGLAQLANIQSAHLALLSKYRIERAKAIVKLVDDTSRDLKKIQANMMRSNDMDGAAAVNAEILRLNNQPEVTQAQTELATADANTSLQ